MRLVRWFATVLLVAGAALTSRAGYLQAKAALASVLIRNAWDASARSGEHRPPWPWADTYPVARLRIPRLGYDEIVLEGASQRTLAFGPAHMQNGAAVGSRGNLLVAGHRDSWFRPLEKIAPGDIIQVEWTDGHGPELHTRNYEVRTIEIVDPQNVGLLRPTTEDALTLITCYPFGRSPFSPRRFVVRAVPADRSSHAKLERAKQ